MNPSAKARFLKLSLDQPALRKELCGALRQVFSDPERIPDLFTENYIQTTNGSMSNRQEFEAHIRHVAGVVQSIDFEVLEVVQQGETIADRHLVHIVYQDGRRATVEVFLFGEISDGRFQQVHEITRLVSGDESLQGLETAR